MFPSFTKKYQAVDSIALVSLLLISIVLLSYILIPAKSQANLQKISLAIAVFALTSTKCFTMFQDYSNTFCENAFVTATFQNSRCGFEAFLVTFGSHAVPVWASMRVYTVLALITYQRSITSTKWKLVMSSICWGVPLVFAFGSLASRMVGYAFSGTCGVTAALQPIFFSIPIIVKTSSF